MRGFANPTALMVGPGVNGFDPALNTRYPYDPDAAKKHLAEAGYPDGFEIGFDCPNDRYVNDEAICQAVVAMLARVGVKASLLAQTRAKFFAKINAPRFETSFYLLGWTPGTYDALDAFSSLAATRTEGSLVGAYNAGGYSNPHLDEVIKQIQVELDHAKRQKLISDGLTTLKEDFAYIPLHQQVVVWATRDNVDLAQTGDNLYQLRYVKLK
jgi:peptide/nickel transport system substrate-binding protein